MIKPSDCILVGKVNKTHGLGGELSISFFSDELMAAIEPGGCVVFDIDGIYTPFFVRSVRPRAAEALLVAFDDVDDQAQAQAFVGKSVYAVRGSDTAADDEEQDGFYAGQLIGFSAVDADTGSKIGVIADIDDATDNVLFVITRPNGGECRVPVVDDFITSISRDDKTIEFSLPAGLLDL